MEAVKVSSEKRGDEHINLALVTDGLKSEREQGITIDVAYRYFATPKRSLSLPTLLATFNTHGTWSQGHQQQILPLFS